MLQSGDLLISKLSGTVMFVLHAELHSSTTIFAHDAAQRDIIRAHVLHVNTKEILIVNFYEHYQEYFTIVHNEENNNHV